ncbi:MAG: hypothetical protein IJT42_08725, partial [Treponema sp.]|nr:hypothetical protein [Treponema sp.]
LNVEEINPAELKFDLIKSADMKATVMLESELFPLRKQIRIIDESFELISTAEEQIESLKKEIGQIEAENQDLLLYKENLLENSKNLPEAVRQMNSMIIDKAASEIQANKDRLAVQRRSLTLVSSKLKKNGLCHRGGVHDGTKERVYCSLAGPESRGRKENADGQREEGRAYPSVTKSV